jgi:hypothetical protein
MIRVRRSVLRRYYHIMGRRKAATPARVDDGIIISLSRE